MCIVSAGLLLFFRTLKFLNVSVSISIKLRASLFNLLGVRKNGLIASQYC